jgi:hypothetical protein
MALTLLDVLSDANRNRRARDASEVVVMMMVSVQVVSVCGANRDQNLYRRGNRYYAQSIAAPRRFG